MAVAVIVSGVVAIAITWPTRSREDRPPDTRRTTRAAIAWAIVAIASLSLLELGSFLLGRETVETKYTHPARAALVDPDGEPSGRAQHSSGGLWLVVRCAPREPAAGAGAEP